MVYSSHLVFCMYVLNKVQHAFFKALYLFQHFKHQKLLLVCYFHAKIIFQSLYVFEFPKIRSVLSFHWDEINTTIFLIMIFFNFYFRS